jgi:uncharacterized protein YndB with AHSA1/START domain
MQDRIERSIDIAAPLERVWQLVTEPGWWITESAETTADRTVGAVTHPPTDSGRDFPVQLVALTPQRHVAFRWASQFPDEKLTEARSTLIEFTLTPGAGTVRVDVVESGFAALDAPTEVRQAGIDDNSIGWEQMLALLRTHAEATASASA